MIKTVYASEYAHLDSDVYTGGGTDDTGALQALLDKAVEWGRLHLILDGAALVRGLRVHANTTIECPDKSCGLFLADDSDCAVLINAEPSYDGITDRNITLLGGTYNHNCLHQKHSVVTTDPALTIGTPDTEGAVHFTVALEFIGVENLTIRDVTVCDQRTFALTVGNFRHVIIENTFVELRNEIPFGNQDGFHFWGPGQFLTIRNVGGRTGDDFMNIGPDERDGVSAITDVLVDGVMLDRAYQGIRLLSRGHGRLDRVTIRNVTGTYRCYGFYINPWFIEDTMGNFGSIVFENIDLRPLDNVYPNPPFLFSVGGDIESLTLRNIQWYHPADARNIFQIGYPWHDVTHPFREGRRPVIDQLLIDGLQVTEDSEASAGAEHMLVRGIVRRCILRDVDVFRPKTAAPRGTFLKILSDGTVEKLMLNRIYAENLDVFADCREGEVQTLILHDIVTDAMGEGFLRGQPQAIRGGLPETSK